jgi:hypothetical protein
MFVTFEPERRREAVGARRCSLGVYSVLAINNKDGKRKSTVSKDQKTIMSTRLTN